jgi:hypothetical protein
MLFGLTIAEVAEDMFEMQQDVGSLGELGLDSR